MSRFGVNDHIGGFDDKEVSDCEPFVPGNSPPACEYTTQRALGRSRVNRIDAAVQVAIARTREQVARLHEDLVRYELVVWTSGSVSARVAGADLFVIKPSDVFYDDLTPQNLVLCDFAGNVIENTPGWDRSPSHDAAAHAHVYRTLPSVGGIVHTHSTFATAWATRGEAIPCVLTTMARSFGGEIPIGPLATLDGDEVGRGIVDALGSHRSRVVLMQNHGVFAVGSTPTDAVRAAVIAEDSARTVHAAHSLGAVLALPQAVIDGLWEAGQTNRTRLGAGESQSAP
jgi:L-ribulose-5-phosphate 4-epimerase